MEPQRHPQPQWRSRSFLALAALISFSFAIAAIFAPAAEARHRVVASAPSRDFSVRVLADAQTVSAGGVATYPFVLRAGSRFRGAVFFEVVGLPGGVSTRVVSLGRNQFDLELATQANLPSSSNVATLRATSGGRSRVALVRITIVGNAVPPAPEPPVTLPPPTVPPQPPVTQPPVTQPPVTQPPAPIFDLRVVTPQNTAVTGQQVQYFINVDRSAGYQGNVTFAVTGLPAGAQGGFGPNPTVAGTVLYVTPSAATPSGTYVLGVSAQAGPSVRTTALILIVKAQSDFTLGVIPAAITLTAPQIGFVALDVRPTDGNGSAVSLEVSGLPSGATAKFAKSTVTAPTTLSLSITVNTAGGTYPITITGRSGQFVHMATLQLTVQNTPGFGLSAKPATVTVPRPGAVATFIAVTPGGGFSGPVAITFTGLPTGATPTVGATPGGAYVTFTVAAATAPGTYPITVTGTSGALSAAISVIVQIV